MSATSSWDEFIDDAGYSDDDESVDYNSEIVTSEEEMDEGKKNFLEDDEKDAEGRRISGGGKTEYIGIWTH